MIVIINGSVGVGKASVADKVHRQFGKSVCLDGDYIGDVNPFEIYDAARIDHLYRTLAHLIAFHRQNGYQNFVINYVFEAAEQTERIRQRGRESIEWELNRFVALQQIQEAAAKQGFIGKRVDTTKRNVEEVARVIWEDANGR